MSLYQETKTLIQCDFDGTITEEDVSFLLLGEFAQGDWQRLLEDYREHRISVGYFNQKAFAMIKVGEQALVKTIRDSVKIRHGFHDLVAYCRRRDFRFVIVSNGLDFYIERILSDIGIEGIEVHAARTRFSPVGMEVQYIGPDGSELEDGFKETYARLFLEQDYRVVYVGNGDSDAPAARLAHHIFARGELLDHCKENHIKCQPFEDLTDIVNGLKLL